MNEYRYLTCPYKRFKGGRWYCDLTTQECPEDLNYQECSTYIEEKERMGMIEKHWEGNDPFGNLLNIEDIIKKRGEGK